MATVYQGGASIDERGKTTGGAAGNQSSKELRKALWYIHKKGWYVLRARDPRVRKAIAKAMRAAIANKRIGYDQAQRNTLYNAVKYVGFDPARVLSPVETDCSALVRVCLAYAGITVGDFNTASQVARLMATGEFELLASAMYCTNKNGDYLLEGDIAVTRTQGHTVVVLNDGVRAAAGAAESAEPTLRKGARGEAVKAVQTLLRAWDAKALPKYGVDSDFGAETDAWVRKFQTAHALEVDGIVGPATWKMLGAYAVAGTGGEDDGRDEEADRATPDTTATAKRPTLSKGDGGAWVKTLQQALLAWSSLALPRYGADGDFGAETQEWVRKFQVSMGIGADGIVGPRTWAKIDAI